MTNAVKFLEKFAAENNCHLSVTSGQAIITAPTGKRFYAADNSQPHVLSVKGRGGWPSLASSLYELVSYGIEDCRCDACRAWRVKQSEKN